MGQVTFYDIIAYRNKKWQKANLEIKAMSNNTQNQVLTNTIDLPSVAELILSKPELQSDFSSEFFSKLELPQVSLGSEISITAGSRKLTIKLAENFANEVVRPFAYFLNENNKIVVLSYATKDDKKDLFTIIEGQEESLFSGTLVQLEKLNQHPEFIKFLDFSEYTLLNTDYRSEHTKNIEGAEEFEIKSGVRTFKFYGKLICKVDKMDNEDHYDVYVDTIVMKFKHDKDANTFQINMPDLPF